MREGRKEGKEGGKSLRVRMRCFQTSFMCYMWMLGREEELGPR